MSIQYAGGTIINTTLTQSAGTRAELAQWVRDELIAAGWSSSGSATDYQLTSATTPQSLNCRVRSYDPGSGNCAKLKFSNVGGTKTQVGDFFLLPAVSKIWRIIANKYQFFVMTPGTSVAREFACGGVPFLPTFLNGVTTECIWGWSNALSDSDATGNRGCPRYGLDSYGSANANGNQWGDQNGTLFEMNAAQNNGIGLMRFNVPCSAQWIQGPGSVYRWSDNSLLVSEPLIGWGLTSFSSEAKINGQLWDSVLITDSFTADANITLDSRTYWGISGSNAGTTGSYAAGTLFVAVT